jgi:hypothetical protein
MEIYTGHVSVDTLRRGSILATIAHAIWTVHSPELAHEHSWSGPNYNIQDTAGRMGTVTFSNTDVVAAFFDTNSPRNPFVRGQTPAVFDCLSGIPAELLTLAKQETLQYLLQEDEGSAKSFYTAAFWSMTGELVASEPWHSVLDNGASLISTQLMELESAFSSYQEYYELTDNELLLLRRIQERIFSDPAKRVILTADDMTLLLGRGQAGLAESRQLFQSVNIIIP